MVIYIPGFKNSGAKDGSVTAIRSAYREKSDHNVIVIDWMYYARHVFYATLVPQLKIVSENIAKLKGLSLEFFQICESVAVNLEKFLNKGYDINKIHLVGHSMGKTNLK